MVRYNAAAIVYKIQMKHDLSNHTDSISIVNYTDIIEVPLIKCVMWYLCFPSDDNYDSCSEIHT